MDVLARTEVVALAPPTAVSWIAYIVIGGVAGWLAGKFVKGAGQGIILNVVVGVIGGFIGGLLLGWLGVDVEGGHRIFTFFVAFLGSVILLWIVGKVRKA